MTNVILFGAGASFGSASSNVPPLGVTLFSELQKFNPQGWGRLPDNLSSSFEQDFEKGMTELAQWNSHAMPILQRAMAAYFFNFYPSPSNLYVELGKRIRNTKWKGALATLNYERLLELSLLSTGVQPVVWNTDGQENSIELCLPHGCCHIFCESVKGTSQGVSFSGVDVTTDGPVRVIPNPQEFNSRINEDAFPPVMSYFQPDKATTSGMSFINGQRERWKQLVASAAVIGIIGVRVRSSDSHIWDALQHTKAKLVYCSGVDGGKEFLEWKQHVRPSSSDKAFYGYFKESFDDICAELNIKIAT
jgi:hypothetical protein